MAKLYRVSIDVLASKVGTVVSLLASEGFNLTVGEVPLAANLPRARNASPTRAPKGQGKAEETRTGRLFVEFVRQNPGCKPGQVGIYLEQNGFARKTASPIASKLTAQGILRRDANGGLTYNGV